MDPRMNEYGGCQPSYQGCGMNQGMNGFDGYQSSSQYGGFGYDGQQYNCVNNQQAYANNQETYHQGPYTNNQGSYHHQQWNNNFQDHSSSSTQCQEEEIQRSLQQIMERLTRYEKRVEEQREEDRRVLDVVDEMETPIVDEIDKEDHLATQEPSSSSSQCKDAENEWSIQQFLDELREKNKRVLDVVDEMESSIEEEIDREDHLAHYKDDTRMDEEASAKGDSNEQTPKTLTMEKDIPKVKESLQALLGSDDMGEFLSKVEHLKFILDNKEMLGEVLHEYEEEQCSNIHMRALFKEAPSMEKKETVRSEDVIQVENVVKTTEAVKYDPPLVVERREKLQPLKHAKRKRRKKPKKTKGRGIEQKPPLLTFTPLRFVDGKLECKVSSKGRSKPFSKVKILLAPGSKGEDWGAINEAMVKAFSMKLGDRGPLYQSKFPIPPNG